MLRFSSDTQATIGLNAPNSHNIGQDPFSKEAWELYKARVEIKRSNASYFNYAESRANFAHSILFKRSLANCTGEGPLVVDELNMVSHLWCKELYHDANVCLDYIGRFWT